MRMRTKGTEMGRRAGMGTHGDSVGDGDRDSTVTHLCLHLLGTFGLLLVPGVTVVPVRGWPHPVPALAGRWRGWGQGTLRGGHGNAGAPSTPVMLLRPPCPHPLSPVSSVPCPCPHPLSPCPCVPSPVSSTSLVALSPPPVPPAPHVPVPTPCPRVPMSSTPAPMSVVSLSPSCPHIPMSPLPVLHVSMSPSSSPCPHTPVSPPPCPCPHIPLSQCPCIPVPHIRVSLSLCPCPCVPIPVSPHSHVPVPIRMFPHPRVPSPCPQVPVSPCPWPYRVWRCMGWACGSARGRCCRSWRGTRRATSAWSRRWAPGPARGGSSAR